VEVRVLGSLLEKEATTPEYYPLTLNALTAACNQKSSREPVMELDGETVARAVFNLIKKGLIAEKSQPGSRALRYTHNFSRLIEGSREEVAVLAVLMLRGPQTSGEIRSRSERLAEFSSPAQVEEVLQRLAHHTMGPFVVKLARQPGRKENRYAHLLCGAPEGSPVDDSKEKAESSSTVEARLAKIEQRLSVLENRLLPNPKTETP